MPMIKLSKGFTRRKSSGNALEELSNPPEPSFRVFERPGSKSFDGGNTLKRMSQGRPLSAGPPAEDNLFGDTRTGSNQINRSGGTNNSTSSNGQTDNSSTSARFSSSSTLPSSTDTPLDEKPLPNPKDSRKYPIPPIPEPHPLSVRAGRTFSFGRKKTQLPPIPPSAPQSIASAQSVPGYFGVKRERGMTESSYASESTATPPRLLDTALDLGESDLDGFGSMFDNFGKRRSQILGQDGLGMGTTESPEKLSLAGPKVPTKSYFPERSTMSSPTIQTVDSSSYLSGSRSPRDVLIQSNTPVAAESASKPVERPPPVPRHGQGPLSTKTMPVPSPNNPSVRPRPQRPQSGAGAGLRRSGAYASSRESSWQDEDAKLVMDSVGASRKPANLPNSFSLYRDGGGDGSGLPVAESSSYPYLPSKKLDSSPGPNIQSKQRPSVTPVNGNDQDFQISILRLESSESTPRAKQRDPTQQTEPSLFDMMPSSSTRLRAPQHQAESNIHKLTGQPKVMTPAQFERYRKEQETSRTKSKASTSDGSDDENDNYDDDDETERNKQLARQRRKQEAHLAVYRQQMMKMTGEQPSDLPNIGQLRSGPERAMTSTPDRTTTPTISFDKAPEKGKGSDDEDEDIPLGILAAHGFPTKNRPPTILSNAGVNSYIRYASESYPAPPMSTAGTSIAGGGKRLPPFARNLPQDPYYGAGLVNPSNRESLAFGASGGSVHGGHSSNLNPGGLVGVIAGEERARAMRRGSPNAQGNYSSPLPQGIPQMPMEMQPGMWPMPMMAPGEEAQVQMSHQMTQMMQMQMQWMQQMQQMVAGGMQVPQPGLPASFGSSPHQQTMRNGFLSPPGQIPRPISVGSHSASGSPGLAPHGQQRAMSMIGSSNGSAWPSQMNPRLTAPHLMSGGMVNQGYAPSIAPSERSNIGMPSRYRPVSIAPNDEAPRSNLRESTFLSGGSQLGSSDRRGSLMTTSIRPVQQTPPPAKGATVSDDDDEQGWEQMKQKREKKKSSWKSKKKDEPNIESIYFSKT